MRSIKAIRMKKPARASRAKRARKAGSPAWWRRPATIATATVAAVIAVVLVAAYQSSPPPIEPARANAQDADRAEAKRLGMDPTPMPPRRAAAPPAAKADNRQDPDDAATTSRESTSQLVTITGCLEQADDAFRLKDANGTGVPRARSWKTGFLRKSGPTIAVVDSGNRLPAHVGERISVTGTLVDRTMQVRSLQRLAASCQAGGKAKA